MVNNKSAEVQQIVAPQLTLANMLQVLFIYLKLTEQIGWNWFQVLLPTIILICLYFVAVGGSLAAIIIRYRRNQKKMKEIRKSLGLDE